MKSLLLAIALCFCCGSTIFAQQTIDFYGTKYRDPIVDTLPVYPGGKNELMDYISFNFRVNQSMKGQVSSIVHHTIFTFIVDTSGSIHGLQIQNCPSSFVEKEFRRVFATMHNWKPAIHNGEKQAVQVDLGFDFILDEFQLMYMPNNGPVVSGIDRGKRPVIKFLLISVAVLVPVLAILSSEFK